MPSLEGARTEKNLLTAHELDMLVRWLRGDDRHQKAAEK